ncbi:hypothetical protein BX600DRAFT_467128 [Xylariales sp. PMI_506]|nr:hypothetical protein BX600DRAFT_467128 [Xylariales sp. PMI_506]
MWPLRFTYAALFGASLVKAADTAYTTEQLYDLTTNFWDNFMYPNNCAQSEAINSTLFSEDVLGRIDVTRDFVGVELNTEYIFGLFCNLQASSTFNVFGTPLNYTLTQFVGQGNLVANTVLIYFNISSVDLITPVSIQSYLNFDADGKIYQYDAIFKWMDWQFSTVIIAAAALLGTTDVTVAEDTMAELLAQNICGVEAQYCTGDLQQYDSTDDCMAFLTQDIPLGEAWQLGMDTLTCRDMHVNMVPFRPDVHCMHIGPTGGGYCTNDRTYGDFVSTAYFTDKQAMLQT